MAAVAPVLRERSVRSGVPADAENLLFPSLHGIMQKTEYPGLAQLVARVVWEKPPGQSHNFISGCCAVGSAPALGARGSHP